MADNLPSLMKNINPQIQETERMPNKIKTKEIDVQAPHNQTVENQKAARNDTLQRGNNSNDYGFFIRNYIGQKEVVQVFSSAKRKELPTQQSTSNFNIIQKGR